MKALEAKTPKKHKNGFSAFPDMIEFPHQLIILLKEIKCTRFVCKVCFFFFGHLQCGTFLV